ncbi:hypothetical protein GCM10023185_21340 [Hymenobacter saemangeumensis]|uniref:Tetratricopeptide repeat protein n=1 Tax=Hymenobacter saemangeumensis TaxID=1084522 RepID=A0ABP8IDZ7_9BACT
MKKSFLTIAAAAALTTGLSNVSLAQTSAVTNAILNQRQGLYDKARTDIDKAVLHEKTSGKAKTWYTRGEIYEQMMDSPIFGKQLQPGEGTQKAFESYSKAIELDGKTGEFGKQAAGKMDNLYARAFNDGVNNYNAKDFDKAITSYKLASQIRPADTTVVLYSAYASEAKQDIPAAKASYNQLIGMGYKSPSMFIRLLQIARQEKNEAEAAKVLKAALEAYPTNKTFLIEDLNMSMSSGSGGDALAKINKAIEADPNNSNLYAVRGSLFDQQKKTDLAQKDYQKAIELDPTNFDAQFNLGVYNFNRGIDMMNKARKMDLKTYQSSGKKMEAEGKKIVEQSIPYFEQAMKVQPEDRVLLISLQKAYINVGRTADAERINAKLESMGK